MHTKDDVGPYKHVNGEDVLMSDEERQEVANKWNAASLRGAAQLQSPVQMILSDPVILENLKAALAK